MSSDASPDVIGVPDAPRLSQQAAGKDEGKNPEAAVPKDGQPTGHGTAGGSAETDRSPPKETFEYTTDFLSNGIEKITLAVAADTERDYQKAYNYYLSGSEQFVLAIKWQKNEKYKALLKTKLGEYLDRAEALKNYLSRNSQPTAEPTASQNTSSSRADAFLDPEAPTIIWQTIAGLDDTKITLEELAILPVKFPQLFKGARKPAPSVLLCGVPGTGKQTLAKALAWEANATVMRINAEDFDQEQRSVNLLFEAAEIYKPTFIIISQIESLFHESRISSNIRFELQERMKKAAQGGPGSVTVMASTSKPWEIGESLLQCFQLTTHIPLPDRAGRTEIFQRAVEALRRETSCSVAPDDCQQLGDMSDGFSRRDISDVVQAALARRANKIMMATHYKEVYIDGAKRLTPCVPWEQDAIEQSWTDVSSEELLEPPVDTRDFLAVMKNRKATASKSINDKIARWTSERMKRE